MPKLNTSFATAGMQQANDWLATALKAAKWPMPQGSADMVVPTDATMDASDLVNPLTVALKPPAEARMAGAKLVEMLRTRGLPVHEVDKQDLVRSALKKMNVSTTEATNIVDKIPTLYVTPPEGSVDALEFAQRRWPRLFGHLTNIEDVLLRHQRIPGSNVVAGYHGPVRDRPTTLRLNSSLNGAPEDWAATVGHELQHSAEDLTRTNFFPDYETANMLDGYADNIWEKKADLQGERTLRYFKGEPRKQVLTDLGKNPLAPWGSKTATTEPSQRFVRNKELTLTPESLAEIQKLVGTSSESFDPPSLASVLMNKMRNLGWPK